MRLNQQRSVRDGKCSWRIERLRRCPTTSVAHADVRSLSRPPSAYGFGMTIKIKGLQVSAYEFGMRITRLNDFQIGKSTEKIRHRRKWGDFRHRQSLCLSHTIFACRKP